MISAIGSTPLIVSAMTEAEADAHQDVEKCWHADRLAYQVDFNRENKFGSLVYAQWFEKRLGASRFLLGFKAATSQHSFEL